MLVAAAQYCASNDVLENQDTIARLISQASSQNVSLVCFPECANLIAKNKMELLERAEPADNSKTIKKIKLFISTIRKEVHKEFKNPKLRSVLEFPVLFLGAKASNTPAFYSFMNYADFGLGTFQPTNGFYDLVNAMVKLGKSLGVKYYTNKPVNKINVSDSVASSIEIDKKNKLLFN